MTQTTQEMINEIENHEHHFWTYIRPEQPNREVYDDGFVYITRNGVKFAFKNGYWNPHTMLQECDVARFSRFVDEVITRREEKKE